MSTAVGTVSAASQLVTGYNANVGVISALMGKGDDVVSDALNHASLIDGARLSGARKHVYAHADATDAAAQLGECGNGNRMLVTDSVFSMDGDTAPLAALATAVGQADACLAVDDAHGLGVFGPQGAGRVAEAGLDSAEAPVLLAALGKSVGAAGAFVAGDADVIEAILQAARSLIFSTAPPPAIAAAARGGVALARAGGDRRRHLITLIARFRRGARQLGLPITDSHSPIQPLLLGEEAVALAASDGLLQRGYLVGAI